MQSKGAARKLAGAQGLVLPGTAAAAAAAPARGAVAVAAADADAAKGARPPVPEEADDYLYYDEGDAGGVTGDAGRSKRDEGDGMDEGEGDGGSISAAGDPLGALPLVAARLAATGPLAARLHSGSTGAVVVIGRGPPPGLSEPLAARMAALLRQHVLMMHQVGAGYGKGPCRRHWGLAAGRERLHAAAVHRRRRLTPRYPARPPRPSSCRPPASGTPAAAMAASRCRY
jgi:hypothetical protein